MLGEQVFDYDFSLFDSGGIVLALDGEAYLAILEAVEDIAGGDGTEAGVINFADGGALFDVDVEDPAFVALLALEADVFEVAGVPESVEVALEGGGVVDVANFAEDAGSDGVSGDAAVAVDLDADDEVSLAESGCDDEEDCDQAHKDGNPASRLLTRGT
jgi:hypothetical protein